MILTVELCLSYHNIIKMNKEIIFKEVAGMWQRVDSQEPHPQTLAEVLDQLNIIVDDNTQFCRIIRYTEQCKETIIYRVYGYKITINLFYNYE